MLLSYGHQSLLLLINIRSLLLVSKFKLYTLEIIIVYSDDNNIFFDDFSNYLDGKKHNCVNDEPSLKLIVAKNKTMLERINNAIQVIVQYRQLLGKNLH